MRVLVRDVVRLVTKYDVFAMTRTYRIGSSRKDKRWSKQCEFDSKSGPNGSQVWHAVYILCLFLSKSALNFLEIITGP